MISYEYPLNERIRTLLRLEAVFERAVHFAGLETEQEHHAALMAIFEVLEIAGRTDLKMDLIQELERQRQTILGFRKNPNISEQALEGVLYQIEPASSSLIAMTGKIGQYLRDNEWLMAIKSRAAIPGGLCEFDLPSYHYWLSQRPETRRETMAAWLKPMLPIREALGIVLRLLRRSAEAREYTAKGGAFQLMLGGSQAQMARIALGANEPAVPEMSANRFALNVRFLNAPGVNYDPRGKPIERDITFHLTLCNL